MLLRMLATLVRPAPSAPPPGPRPQTDPARRNVLDVGGRRGISLPPHYGGWRQLSLDIDPNAKPDVVLDARELLRLDAGLFDAVYCSHNLEHYYTHDVPKVLSGFAHVLKADGFAEIRVPDVAAVAREIAQGRELDEVLYTSVAGPISVRDVLYGFGRMIEKSGEDYFAHKTGFTPRLLAATLKHAGFGYVHALQPLAPFEIRMAGLRTAPAAYHRQLLGLPETAAQPLSV